MADSGGPASVGHRGHRRVAALRRAAPDGCLVDVVSTRLPALLVYSSSPVWQVYFETRVLPALGARVVVLNWSERKEWRLSLAVVLFKFFGGSREFNPMAIVFEPLAWPRRFRFYRAFHAFKHGQRDEVERLRRELFQLLDRVASMKAA